MKTKIEETKEYFSSKGHYGIFLHFYTEAIS